MAKNFMFTLPLSATLLITVLILPSWSMDSPNEDISASMVCSFRDKIVEYVENNRFNIAENYKEPRDWTETIPTSKRHFHKRFVTSEQHSTSPSKDFLTYAYNFTPRMPSNLTEQDLTSNESFAVVLFERLESEWVMGKPLLFQLHLTNEECDAYPHSTELFKDYSDKALCNALNDVLNEFIKQISPWWERRALSSLSSSPPKG